MPCESSTCRVVVAAWLACWAVASHLNLSRLELLLELAHVCLEVIAALQGFVTFLLCLAHVVLEQ